jgi:hypothetical protein
LLLVAEGGPLFFEVALAGSEQAVSCGGQVFQAEPFVVQGRPHPPAPPLGGLLPFVIIRVTVIILLDIIVLFVFPFGGGLGVAAASWPLH